MGLFPPAPGGGECVAYGYKGKGVTIHLLAEACGRPIGITSTAANGDERQQVSALLDQVGAEKWNTAKSLCPMVILEGDKGYDCQWLRNALLKESFFPLIPWRKNKRGPDLSVVKQTFSLQSLRWQIERAFSWIKRKSRRLALRWERKMSCWLAFTTLALIDYWLEILVR